MHSVRVLHSWPIAHVSPKKIKLLIVSETDEYYDGDAHSDIQI